MEALLKEVRLEILGKLKLAIHQEWWDGVERLSAAYARLGLADVPAGDKALKGGIQDE